MSISHDSRYAYAVGRIRVLETRLLDMAKLSRMIEAKNADEAMRILGETEYADLVSRAAGPHDYAQVTAGEITRVYSLMKKLLPDEPLVDLFLIKYDIHNMKVALKAHFQGKSFDHLLIDAGLVPAKLMTYVCQQEKFPGVPEEYYGFAAAAARAYEDSKDPKVIDVVLDRLQYSHTIAFAEQHGYAFLARLLASQADLANMKSLVRTKRLGRGRDFLAENLLAGGTMPQAAFLEAVTEDYPAIVGRFSGSPYRAVVEQGIGALLEGRGLTTLEKLSDGFLTELSRKARFQAFGPEPIINYILAKENEVRNIRIIMIGKLNGVPNEEIRERLREGYA
ncbi:MAG: V-type ATP synthase subunit C [Selenomonadales bacterium]|nr:V-type ATP synthase subunit C [Selenomonadales bacterium]